MSTIDVNCKDSSEDIPLHGLAKMGDNSGSLNNLISTTLKRMIDLKVDINQQNIHGETPLFVAVLNEKEFIASELISHKADINIKTK